MDSECYHYVTKKTEKIFKNGTKHLEVRCVGCDKFFGYRARKKPNTRKNCGFKEAVKVINSL